MFWFAFIAAWLVLLAAFVFARHWATRNRASTGRTTGAPPVITEPRSPTMAGGTNTENHLATLVLD